MPGWPPSAARAPTACYAVPRLPQVSWGKAFRNMTKSWGTKPFWELTCDCAARIHRPEGYTVSTELNTARLRYVRRSLGLYFLHSLRTTPTANTFKRKEPMSEQSPSTMLPSLTGLQSKEQYPLHTKKCV